MSIMNMFLQSLLEAPGDNARTNTQNRSNRRRNQNDDADNPDNQADDTDTTETNEEGEDNQDGDDTEGTEEETGEDNDTEQGNEDEAENEDEQDNEEETGDDETEGEDNEGEGDEDDFSMNPDDEGEGEDNEPPPDGLTDPDDDGSNDEASTEDEGETNIHTNVLNLSKLDRLLAKRKCLSDFYDLRTSVDTFRSVIENNEAVIDPDIRQAAVRDLNKLYTSIGEYLMYRFGYTNYEENLQNYFIFIRSMNDIVKVVGEKGMKNPNKT